MSQKTLKKKEEKLPWWVEFLFVQIGLPDSWLRNYLKLKKSSIKSFNSNKKKFSLAFLFCFAVLYISPVIKNYSLRNQCISETKKFIINDLKQATKFRPSEVSIVAHNFCNGGNLEY